MSRTLLALLACWMVLTLAACGGGNAPVQESAGTDAQAESAGTQTQSESAAPVEETPAAIPDLSGEWKQSNSNAEDSYQAAYISDDAMEIYWIIGEGSDEETIALYWAGSFTPPASADEPYQWESANDTSRTGSAMLASGDKTKNFTYQDGKISYSVTIQDQTVDVELSKQEWGYGTKSNDNIWTDLFFNGGGSESKSAETMSGAGDLGEYHVEIKNAALAHDYDGNPAIIVTYAWTNNSEETTSAMMTILEKAFQDGVELDRAFIADSSVYDSDMKSKDVRPGTTIDAQCAFVLTSETSTVEFELSEAFSWTNNDKVTMDFNPSELGLG